MGRKHLTPAEKQKIRRSYAQGTAIPSILNTYNISRYTLYHVVTKLRGPKPRKPNEERRNAIATLNYRGYSDLKIADKLGIDPATVCRHRNKMGLPVIPANERRS
ncbi:MAG: hypothetical protein H0W28_07525 [Pyrinomonadaceae bacterium]|nr:hypothetical protein [Pyrinomonadaceae bacterium]